MNSFLYACWLAMDCCPIQAGFSCCVWCLQPLGYQAYVKRLLIQIVFSSSCYNCGGLDHHAKECGLPPQPKKCHYCQSASHMVAHCPHKSPLATQGRFSLEPPSSSSVQSPSPQRVLHTSQDSSTLSKASSSPKEPTAKAASSQRKKRKK